MALNQLPVVDSTINVVHSGPIDGESFTTTLDASDGAPIAQQQVFTFDLTVFAPDLVGNPALLVEVYRNVGGEKVEVDVKVEADLITLTFWDEVEPADYRVKVMG